MSKNKKKERKKEEDQRKIYFIFCIFSWSCVIVVNSSTEKTSPLPTQSIETRRGMKYQMNGCRKNMNLKRKVIKQ